MTNKTYRFAAVAAVLLALCLVFMAPVSAEDVVLSISGAGSESAETTFIVDGVTTTPESLQVILNNFSLVNDKTVILPEGTLYLKWANSHNIEGNITVIGKGMDKTTLMAIETDNCGRLIRLYNRDAETVLNGDGYTFTFKDFTMDSIESIKNKANAFFVTSYNVEINVENVTFKNLNSVIEVWGSQSLTNIGSYVESDKVVTVAENYYPNKDANVGVTLNLKSVTATDNNRMVGYQVMPDSSSNTEGYSFIALNYDATSTLKNKDSEVDGIYKKDGLSDASYNIDLGDYFQGNMLINGEDITLGSAVAKIGDTYYGTLAEAVAAANEGETVTLLKDVTLTDDIDITVGMDVTIEGKGKNITSANKKDVFYVSGGKLTLGDGLDVYSPTDCAVYIRGGDVITYANLKADGGYAPLHSNKDNSGNVTVNGGLVDGSVASVAVYWPQGGNLIVNDGVIIGTTGIEIRGGTLTVNGGTISGSAPFETRVTEGGNTVMGAGIAVSQFTPNPDTVVVINDGIISGEYALYEQNLTTTEKDAEALEKISILINGGTLTGNIFSENEDNFIKGGLFSINPSTYVASGYEVVQPGDKYLVQKYVDRSSSSSSSSSSSTEEPEQPEEPVVEPETPVEEPVAGEPIVETEVTDGGEVSFETPAAEGSEPVADAPVEISAVVLPEGTTGEVAFVPVSEQPAPAGKETQTKKVFEINVPTYEKGKAAVVKFTMTVAELAADGKTAAEVALWHFDEETGEWTKLVTSYTIVDGVVYFEAITYDFSPFAIIYEDAVEQPEQPVEEPETPASPAPVLGVLAALGAAVFVRRK